MGQVYVDENSLSSIGNAIRNITNTTNNFYPNQMGPAIENISMGPEITDASYLFFHGARMSEHTDLINCISPNVHYTVAMFSELYTAIYPSEIPIFNTSSVTLASNMFFNYVMLRNVPAFNFSNLTQAQYMFGNCSNLTYIPNFITSDKLQNLCGTFRYCFNITDTSNISYWNTENVNNVYQMFLFCNHISTINDLNLPKVTDLKNFCGACHSLVSLNNCNFSNVQNLWQSFGQCWNLQATPDIHSDNIINMCEAFNNCISLTEVIQYNTLKVNDMSKTFQFCNNLSNDSIQNIINMCLNSNITNTTRMNLMTTNTYSPFSNTIFDNSYYQDRWQELTDAGWTY